MTVMPSRRSLAAALSAVLLLVCGPAVASAGAPTRVRLLSRAQAAGGFHLAATAFGADQDAGAATITITRGWTRHEAQIRYMTLPGTAVRGLDYTAVKAMIDFAPGQAQASFRIPIVNHGMPEVAKTVRIMLFGAHSTPLGAPARAVLTIRSGTVTITPRDPANPLALTASPPAGDPLTGATPFIDWRYGLAARAARRLARRHPGQARLLDVIAGQPEVHRWGNWSGPHPGLQVSHFMDYAQLAAPGSVPEFATYWLVDAKRIHRRCGHYADPPWRRRAYHRWVQSLARGVGNHRAIMFEEMDSLITVGCLSRRGLAIREHELADANRILSRVPHLVVYMDAGAADAIHAAPMARMLEASGIGDIQGFFLNATHFDWTSHEIRYGEQIARMTGKHFVVNTAENGVGPLRPRNRVKYGNERLCNPVNRGLGPKPTFNPGYPNVDAFAWIANPGKSGGPCRPGAPPTGVFWVKLALELVRHADFSVR